MARRLRREGARAADPVFYVPSLSATHHRLQGHGDAAVPGASSTRTSRTRAWRASVAVFHQRFSTNTLPQWRLAHPYRYLAHNGEINTVAGQPQLGARARSAVPLAAAAGPAAGAAARLADRLGLAEPRQHARGAADGRPRCDACHAAAGAAGLARPRLDRLRICARSTSTTRCTWSRGTVPPGIVLTDGRYAACTLDRNGLRPARFVITQNRCPDHRLRRRACGTTRPRTWCARASSGPAT